MYRERSRIVEAWRDHCSCSSIVPERVGGMLRRRRRKHVVEMSNVEAAVFFVGRARKALLRGDNGRALHHYHTALLHDPTNLAAQLGLEDLESVVATLPADAPPPMIAPPESPRASRGQRRRRRRRRHPWWKRALATVGLYRSQRA